MVNKELNAKLAKIQDMKERGLITEEESALLRKKAVKESLDNPVLKPKTELELKIEKLEDMKARGLINDEDFKTIKMNYIKESVAKK